MPSGKAYPGLQRLIWKCSPMASIFKYPNLVIPHLGPDLESAYVSVPPIRLLINDYRLKLGVCEEVKQNNIVLVKPFGWAIWQFSTLCAKSIKICIVQMMPKVHISCNSTAIVSNTQVLLSSDYI